MDVYSQIVLNIIRHQEAIIGPVAVEQAEQIPNLTVDWDHQQVQISGDPVRVIDGLVKAYRHLFGQISVEVSKEAAASLLGQLQPAQLPSSLR